MWQSLVDYLRESRAELQKVSWPNRDEVVRLTLVVLVVSAATAIYLGFLDSILLKLTQLLIANKR